MWDLAAQQSCEVRKGDQRAPSNQSNSRLHVEVLGPEGKQRAPLEPGSVVDPYGIGGETQDGDAAEQGEGSDRDPGCIDQLGGLGLPLKILVVVRVYLKGRRGGLMFDRWARHDGDKNRIETGVSNKKTEAKKRNRRL